MKSTQKNLWAKLSSSQKLNLIGSGLLLISLFLNWYSDKDVFRSGDTYSAMSGPLYLVGFSLFLLAVGNILLSIAHPLRVPVLKKISEAKIGKWQIIGGFAAMYLLVIINSVYFHPQFGLNILSKKSEIGVMMALVATVMMCIGGYLGLRLKLEKEAVAVEAKVNLVAAQMESSTSRVHQSVEKVIEVAPQTMATRPVHADMPARDTVTEQIESSYSGVKPENDKSKLYENLRKTMIRDTMTPQQRKKERAKDTGINAFSANFGKGPKMASVAASGGTMPSAEDLLKRSQAATVAAATPAVKKPQMYRLDL